MGGEVTSRSDLYSLGAMLYEMVTGRPPFLGDDAVAIIGQHINTPPVAPTWHNGQCPRALDALILRLLAKDPSERPQSADDVLAALDAIDLTTSMEQPPAAVDEAHALDSLAGGVFVGRQQEMGELRAALEDALSGRGRLVMLVRERVSARPEPPKSWPPTPECEGPRFCGAVAMKNKACRPPGLGCRPFALTSVNVTLSNYVPRWA